MTKSSMAELSASEWFVLMQSENVSEDTRRQYEEWLNKSPDNKRSIDEYALVWNDLSTLSQDSWESKKRGFFDLFLARIADFFDRSYVTWGLAASAFSIAVLFATGIISFAKYQDLSSFETEVAEAKQLTLFDGTVVTLGAASKINVWEEKRGRFVTLLRGQVFFDVTPNRRQPFYVNVKNTQVKVVGTAFDAKRSNGTITITVMEGKVQVSDSRDANGLKIDLIPGQQVKHYDDVGLGAISQIPERDIASWQRGRLVFHDARLNEVIADINRYTKKTLRIATPRLGEIPVTVSLDVNKIDTIASDLQEFLPVQVRDFGSHYELVKDN